MAKEPRVVPIRLQDGKAYVTREGLVVYAKWNTLLNRYEHDRDPGPLTIRSIPVGADGSSDKSRDDIIRPAYLVGESYLRRQGDTYTINDIEEGETCTLDGEYTTEGYYYEGGSFSDLDLMDYVGGVAPAIAVPEESPVEALAELPDVATPEHEFRVGDLVRVSDDYGQGMEGMPNFGTVHVVLDSINVGIHFAGWNGGHNLHGGLADESGWFVPAAYLTSHQAAVEAVKDSTGKSGYVFTEQDAERVWDRVDTVGMSWKEVIAARASICQNIGEVIQCG